jgi:hypothetical protein
MTRCLVLVWGCAVLAFVGAVQGGPTTPIKAQTQEIPALGGRVFSAEWEGNRRASAIAIGDGSTYMGLYVYDKHGNCVAWDDEGTARTCDDLAVEWRPRQNAVYAVEIHNNGMQSNRCKVVLR